MEDIAVSRGGSDIAACLQVEALRARVENNAPLRIPILTGGC